MQHTSLMSHTTSAQELRPHSASRRGCSALRLSTLLLLAGLALSGPGCTSKPRDPAATPGADPNAAATDRTAPVTLDSAKLSSQPGGDSFDRGTRLAAEGMKRQALAEFERAIEVNPRLTRAYLGAADIYREQGDYESAQARYATAARLEPTNFDAHYGQGLMLQLLSRFNDAVRAYLSALRIQPDNFDANLNIATAYLALNEPRSGLVYAERAVQLKPDSQPAHTNLGAIYANLGRHQDAVNQYLQAAELAPLNEALLLSLADSLGQIGRFQEMINTLNELIRTSPSSAAYERLGSGYFRAREYANALAAFRTALEIDPNYFPAHNGVGVCLLNEYVWSKQNATPDEDIRAEALRHLRTSVQVEPKQPQVIDLINRFR